MSEQFELVYPEEIKSHVITPVPQNCVYVGGWCCAGYVNPYDLASHGLQGIPGFARVGFYFYRKRDINLGYDIFENIILRSKLIVPTHTGTRTRVLCCRPK